MRNESYILLSRKIMLQQLDKLQIDKQCSFTKLSAIKPYKGRPSEFAK